MYRGLPENGSGTRAAVVTAPPAHVSARSHSGGTRDEHKSAKRPGASADASVRSARSTSVSSARSMDSSRSPSGGRAAPRSSHSKSKGSWYLAPVCSGPGPLPGRGKRKVDDFFVAAKRETLRSTALPRERIRAPPERLEMPDWTANKKRVLSAEDDEQEVQIIKHTVHGRSAVRGTSRSAASSVDSASSEEEGDRDSSSSRSVSPVIVRSHRAGDGKTAKTKLAPKSAPAKSQGVKKSSPNSPFSISSDSASDSASDSSSSDSSCGDASESSSEASSRDSTPPPRKRTPLQTPPRKSGPAASPASSASTVKQSPGTPRTVGKPRALTMTDTAKSASAAQWSSKTPLHRRLSLQSPVSAPAARPSPTGSSASASPRQTRRQVAASMAVEEEMEAHINFEFARKAAAASGGIGGMLPPTKLLHRFASTPLPLPLSSAVASSPSPLSPAFARAFHLTSVDEYSVRLVPSPSPLSSPLSRAYSKISAAVAPAPSSSSSSAAVLDDNASSAEVQLNESALRRLALSSVSQQGYLTWDWIFKRGQKYLGLQTDAEALASKATQKSNPNPQYLAKQPAMGCLASGGVFVAVSARADHNPFYLAEKAKADPQLHEQLMSKWVEIGSASDDEDGSDTDEAMKDSDTSEAAAEDDSSASSAAAAGAASPAAGASGKKASARSKERIPMLGLFASRAFKKGDWVTEYGGVLEWGGDARGRSSECNSHVRRIASSDYVWNGRPWSLLFPRIPSTLAWEASKPIGARTHLEPRITPRTLINLLLLLHHEQESHAGRDNRAASLARAAALDDSPLANFGGAHLLSSPWERAKSVQKPFTDGDIRKRVCTGTCVVCRTEVQYLKHKLGCDAASSAKAAGASFPPAPELSAEDVLAILLPQCCCCSVSLGLLPCEIVDLMRPWPLFIHERLRDLCQRVVESDLVRSGGLGYMANTDIKSAQNVRCHSVSPYTKELGSMKPTVHIYQATRDIAAGEEIFVAYNNNESKKIC